MYTAICRAWEALGRGSIRIEQLLKRNVFREYLCMPEIPAGFLLKNEKMSKC